MILVAWAHQSTAHKKARTVVRHIRAVQESKPIMTQLTSIAQAIKTMSSREIAELTGKQHQHVRRDIDKMLTELGEDVSKFGRIYIDDSNRKQEEFHLDRELTDTLLTGYSAVMRRKVIARWRELEAKAAAPVAPAELSRMEILQLAVDSEKGRLLAIEQRDHAIATKAQIGSKREATAMATAATAKREAVKLRERMGEATHRASVFAVEGMTKPTQYPWLPLRSYCQQNALEMGEAFSPGIQRKVKTYPAEAWMAVYGVDLEELFGEVAA